MAREVSRGLDSLPADNRLSYSRVLQMVFVGQVYS